MDWLRLVVWRIQCACTCPLWFGHTFLSFFLPAEYFFVPLSWYEIHDICIAFSVQQALYVDRGLMRSIRSQNGWRCVRDGEVSEVMRPGSVIRAQIWSRRAIRNYQLPAITNYQLHQPLSALPIAKYVTSMSSTNNISREQQQHMKANQSSRQVRDIVWR